jgi:hypothetical protein
MIAGHPPGGSATALYSMTERRYTPLDQSAGHTIWLRDSKRLLFDEKNGLHIINIQTRERHRVLSVAPQTLNTRFSLSPTTTTPSITGSTRRKPIFG